MEDRTEYLEALRETIDFLERDEAESNIKFGMLKNICDCLINDIEDIYFKYRILKEHVDDIQETLTVVAKSRS